MTVRRVAGCLNLGLIAVLCVILKWPDQKLTRRFITGFQVIGKLEETGIFPPCERVKAMERSQLMAGAATEATLGLMKYRDPTDAKELIDAAKDDMAAQRGSPFSHTGR